MTPQHSDTVKLESLRGVVETPSGSKRDVQLWRAKHGELVGIGETKRDALRQLARKMEDRSAGYVADPTADRDDRGDGPALVTDSSGPVDIEGSWTVDTFEFKYE